MQHVAINAAKLVAMRDDQQLREVVEASELVTADDIRGDLHTHTTLSDGKASLEEMAKAARGRGYAYFAITDHSDSHGFGNHVTPQQLERRIEEIRAWNADGPRGRQGSPGKVTLPHGWLDDPDDDCVPEAEDMHSGG